MVLSLPSLWFLSRWVIFVYLPLEAPLQQSAVLISELYRDRVLGLNPELEDSRELHPIPPMTQSVFF